MAKLKIENRFGIIPNHILNSRFLSWKAKGLYGYIQSKPDDWDFSADRICNDGKDGRDGVRAGIIELEQYGVLIREKIRQENGTYDMEYTLLDTPIINFNHDGKSDMVTMTENPTSENPTSEKPSYNKERNTKKEIVKSNSNKVREFSIDSFEYKMAEWFLESQKNNATIIYLLQKKGINELTNENAKVINDLMRLDGFNEKQIEFIFKKTLEDNFWKNQILTPKKFREKDKNGVLYFIKMIDIVKAAHEIPDKNKIYGE